MRWEMANLLAAATLLSLRFLDLQEDRGREGNRPISKSARILTFEKREEMVSVRSLGNGSKPMLDSHGLQAGVVGDAKLGWRNTRSLPWRNCTWLLI